MPVNVDSCCHTNTETKRRRFDPVMHGSLAVILPVIAVHMLGLNIPYADPLAAALIRLFSTMWWGVALGLLTVGLMNKVPREYLTAVMGTGNTPKDILKAAAAGVLLDLCNHGILIMAGKLYERGLSAAQVMTFLIASPWNSLTLTFVLISLIGWQWTLLFTLASMLVAFVAGLGYIALTDKGILPENPHKTEIPEEFDIKADFKARIKTFRPSKDWALSILKDGWNDGQMVVRWILLGTLIAASMSAFIPAHIFSGYFGPSLLGLGATLIAATIIEVCSEGSAPIASEIMSAAHAPGNGFAFLMAGVATDYTEIMVVREFTKSWKIALFMPLLTVPQIIVLGLLMNL